MNIEDRDIDDLLRGNAERQLRDFDWDRLRGTVLSRVAVTSARENRSGRPFRVIAAALGVAAVVLLTVVFCWRAVPDRSSSLLEQMTAGGLDAGPLGPAMSRTDRLIADTSPRTVLLAGQTYLVCSDPLLMPHSVWEQEPMPASANVRMKEKWQ